MRKEKSSSSAIGEKMMWSVVPYRRFNPTRCSAALALKLLVFLLNGVAVFPRLSVVTFNKLSIGSVPCVAIGLGCVF
jgi:hypothetical protein